MCLVGQTAGATGFFEGHAASIFWRPRGQYFLKATRPDGTQSQSLSSELQNMVKMLDSDTPEKPEIRLDDVDKGEAE